jgi:hypothetical protein
MQSLLSPFTQVYVIVYDCRCLFYSKTKMFRFIECKNKPQNNKKSKSLATLSPDYWTSENIYNFLRYSDKSSSFIIFNEWIRIHIQYEEFHFFKMREVNTKISVYLSTTRLLNFNGSSKEYDKLSELFPSENMIEDEDC